VSGGRGEAQITSQEFDAHILKVFTPDDAIGSDDRRHELVAEDSA
jgi:hypothetical protein